MKSDQAEGGRKLPYLEKLRVVNFKCWEDVVLETKPLTVLIGPNGAGKSSILQALSLLRRFVTTPTSLNLDTLGDFLQADYVNLGTFKDMVHKHESGRSIEIGVVVRSSENVLDTYYVTFGGERCKGELAPGESFSGETSLSVKFTLPYSLNITITGKVTIGEGKEYSVIWNGVSGSVQVTQQQPPPPPELNAFLSGYLELVKGIFLVHPRQFFRTWSYPYTTYIDYSKLSMSDQELASILASNSDVEEKVSTWGKQITGVEVLAKSMPTTSTVRIESRWQKMRVPLALDGAGLNKLVFILTSLAIPQTKLLLAEEPETHLHPKLLFEVGRHLPRILREEGKQMLITSHSEHLILPLLIGVAEGKISREDFVIYYIEKDQNQLSAKARKLDVNEKGQIEGGLPGFFETDWDITEAYLKALAGEGKPRGAGSR